MSCHRTHPGWLLILIGLVLASVTASANADPIDFTALRNVGIQLQVQYRNTTTNSRTGEMRTNVVVSNISNQEVRAPLVLVIDSISVATVALTNRSGTTPGNTPYVDLSSQVGTDRILSPGESSTPFTLIFSNPSRARFTFQSSCLGVVVLSSPLAPTINAHVASTRSLQVTLTGTALDATQVEVSGPLGVFNVPVGSNGAFSAVVSLKANLVNHIFFTGLSSGDIRSAPVVATVTNDSQAPTLQIQFPSDGAEITTATTDVAGFVGDMLSGFNGLTVVVNGQSAEVDIGIGTNGTFFIPSVPLVLGSNSISAIATDALGNAVTRQVMVTRVQIAADAPRMQIVSGNGQRNSVDTLLASPISVRITNGNGTPFPNKVVNFRVTRSNGLLGGDPFVTGASSYQTKTNSNGVATARWRLGSDAGCGNNRVEVTSQSIAGTTAFCATASAGTLDQINIGSGNNQRGQAGSPAALPLVAWVSDGCNGGRGIPVTFVVTEGGGRVNGQSSVTVLTGPTGHAQVNFTYGAIGGNNRVQATYPNNPGLPATFVMFGLVRDENKPTSFSGVVFDNANNPIGGVRCALTVNGQNQPLVFTDADGTFSMSGIPDGSAHLHVDASVANLLNGAPIPAGSFPALFYELVIVPNAENSLPMPILLPPLNPNNAVSFDNTQDVELTVEGVDGLKMIVKAGSMKRPDGTVPSAGDPAIVSLNQVHHDDVPMPMPDGAAPQFAWTLQPGGATFDPPIEIQYPNMSGLPPGAIAYFLSFNHDTGKFEIIAPGSVCADGSTIISDPGTGLTLAGWGCNCPPYAITENCKKCNVKVTGPDVACKDQSVTYTATAVGAGTITWKATGGGASPSSGTGTSFTTKFSSTGAASVVAELKCADGLSDQHGVNVKVVGIEVSSVSGADSIGTDGSGVAVYATGKGAGDVVITIKTNPAGATLPAGAITWSGGSAGANQLSRKVSKAALIESGQSVTAKCGTQELKFRVYVFEGPPAAAAVNVQVTVTRDDTIATPFGLTDRGEAFAPPTEQYKIYYESKKWKFVFEKVAYTITWGVNSGGNADVPNAAANPFPLGKGMAAGSTEAAKKTRAKSDLTPAADGRAPRTAYWSSALTVQHELFHVMDWRDNYHKPKIQEAETAIEMTDVAVTLTNLAPAAALTAKRPDLHTIYVDKTNAAQASYNPDKETRAYGDGKAGYQALANAITP